LLEKNGILPKAVPLFDFEDFLERDLKAFTFPRAFSMFCLASMGMFLSIRYAKIYLPLGQHGITKLN